MKPPQNRLLSKYGAMWMLAMFDLPVKSKKDRKRYTRFRRLLLQEGFDMLQFSVYARYCGGEEAAEAHRAHLMAEMPPRGEVRILSVTDHQFGKMITIRSKEHRAPEKAPEQLILL